MIHPAEIYSSLFPCVQRIQEVVGPQSAFVIKKVLADHNNRIIKVLRLMTSCSGLAVMDGATERGLQYFYPEVDSDGIQIIPIPSVVRKQGKARKLSCRDSLSIGYLGRMDKFKLSVLQPFIMHNLASTERNSTSLHFVGEGDSMNDLYLTCRRAGINLVNHGFRYNDEAVSLLQKYVHLGVAMGTSALDLAGAGIPTIIIDPAFKIYAPRQTLFRFTHEISDNTLGEYRDSPLYVSGLHSFNAILDIVEFDRDLPARQQDYVQEKHGTEICFQRLLNGITQSSLKIEDLAPLAKDIADSYAYIDGNIRGFLRATRRRVDRLLTLT